LARKPVSQMNADELQAYREYHYPHAVACAKAFRIDVSIEVSRRRRPRTQQHPGRAARSRRRWAKPLQRNSLSGPGDHVALPIKAAENVEVASSFAYYGCTMNGF
jgi:hypothetical protein